MPPGTSLPGGGCGQGLALEYLRVFPTVPGVREGDARTQAGWVLPGDCRGKGACPSGWGFVGDREKAKPDSGLPSIRSSRALSDYLNVNLLKLTEQAIQLNKQVGIAYALQEGPRLAGGASPCQQFP